MKNNTQQQQRYATLQEACAYIRVSHDYGKRNWIKWHEKYGVRVSRFGRKIVMPYADLDNMLQQLEVN